MRRMLIERLGRLTGGSRRFGRSREGSSAVEFALVSLPFMLLLLATFETLIVFFASSNLEGATNETARLIRTGQVQANGTTEAQFTQLICDELVMAVDCPTNLRVDVRVFNNFNNVNFPDPVQADGTFQTNFTFQPGVAGDIVLVRAFYSWPIVGPGQIGLSNMAGDKRLLASSFAFRNEPF